MNKLLPCLLLISMPLLSSCTLGTDVSQLFSVATYQCFKNNGYTFNILRAYCSFGGIDHNGAQNAQNSKSAGLITDVYLFPCRSKSASTQVDQLFAAVNSGLFGMVWLDIETNPSSGCGWSGDHNSNCAFIEELINRIKYHGKNPGVYASAYQWTTILGARNACPQAASQPLWYAHYDGSASFSDFSSFGGWTKPAIKQFQGDTTLCGASVDKNFY